MLLLFRGARADVGYEELHWRL